MLSQSVRRLTSVTRLFGMDLERFYFSLKGLFPFFRDYQRFRQANTAIGTLPFGKLYPCLSDRYEQSGVGKGHYFNQDLLVAQRIFSAAPKRHIDIASRIDGFVAHVASFREIEVVDIRPLNCSIANIKFIQSDMMLELSPGLINCTDSLSCLHALEHFGLGRYGDPINPNGHVDGFHNMTKMINTGGKMYLSVPIGKSRIEFNAHRVFSVESLLDLVSDKFSVDTFSFVDDSGNLHEQVELTAEKINSNFDCSYGCGIFELTKL